MNKPKELTGEVKKFEDAILHHRYGMDDPKAKLWLHRPDYITNLLDFYTQPFKPEMIEEYFEGAEVNGIEVYTRHYDTFGEISIAKRDETSGTNYYPKTLSDFVDACVNLEIKLVWK